MNFRHTLRSGLLALLAYCAIPASAQMAYESGNGGTLLSGTPIGSPAVDYSTGNISTTVNQPANAFDGNTTTFYASYDRSRTWVGLDLGEPYVITAVGWCPRNSDAGTRRVQLALFEASNSPDFLDAVPLYLIPRTGAIGRMEYADVNVSRGFRYVRYVGPNEARCNIGELEFYGKKGEGDDSQFYQITNLPTVSIHTYSGRDPADKVNNIEANVTITYDGGAHIQEYPITVRLRGNASMGFAKKPYRIKFNDGKSHHIFKDSPLETPAKAKKWTLINNYGDKTLLRNVLAFRFSSLLGMPFTSYIQPVDVVMNGEYKGCYQLCDQISADPHRVAITEMEPEDIQEPEISGGYLVEVDAYAHNETSWFSSSRGNPVTIKSPDDESIVSQQKTYIRDYFNKMENALYASNYTDPSTGYRQYLDVESFIKNFIVGEFSGNTDTFWSTYMSKERGEATFLVGPCWDFDLAFNNDGRIYPVNNRSDWVFRSGGSTAGNMRSFVSRVLQDPYASDRLKNIWKEMRDSKKFSEEQLVAFIDSMADDIRSSAELNFIRWPILNSRVHQNPVALGSFQAEINVLRDYIPDRIGWIDNYLGYTQGTIVEDSTFYIETPQDLINFAKYVKQGGNGSSAYLLSDINMNGLDSKFTPIGTGQYPFHGTFDGQGHRISNLHIVGASNIGFFGTVTGGACIRNFIFDSSCSISGDSYVGIIGVSNGSGDVIMERIGNEASISASGVNAGSIIGCNYSSSATFTFENCYNVGTIVGGKESGALCGWTGSGATFINCYNIGTVSGYDNTNSYLFRGNGSVINTYSLQGTQGTIVSQEDVVGGALCYKLNGSNAENPIWRQSLDADKYPTFLDGHAIVDYNGEFYYNVGISYTLGDMNGDGAIDAADLQVLANYLVDLPNDIFVMKNADMNGDKTVNVLDIVATANYIKAQNAVKPHREQALDEPEGVTSVLLDDFGLQVNNSKSITVRASLAEPMTAFYAELTPSDGITIDPTAVSLAAMKGSSHVVSANTVDGVTRLIAYSPSSEAFSSLSGEFFHFKATTDMNFTGGTLQLGNVLLSTPSGKGCSTADCIANVTLEATPVSTITFAQDTYIMNKGDKLTLTATVLPATATMKDIAWSCSDTHIAYVASGGVLTARNAGHATLIAKAKDGSGVVGMANLRVLGDNFEIASTIDLQEFSMAVNSGYIDITGTMTADLDMEGVAITPIGTEKNLFAGTFDGQGHVISNLVIESPNATAVGLFGHITSPATIKNLILDSSCMIVGYEKAGLIGRSDRAGSIYLENLGNEGSVTADIAPAGIIGNANNSSVALITNCYSTGTITTITDGKTNADAGQISGWLGNVGAVLTNCWSTSDITGFQTSGYATTTDRTFARTGGAKNSFVNCYSQTSKQVNLTDIEKFRSGEVTYLLNGGNTENPVWRQTLGEDLHPTLLSSHSIVYRWENDIYANTPDGIESVPFGLQDVDIYTMTGVKVDKPRRGGIYIINGMKVLIK
ncbi:MAG: CotH kinase family protein [Bacteroidaceae bacterium]|nr:CotH kinase family protein [Bacteroidaceae bacterium]